MISGKKVLGIIPARGGSKGISKKNINIVGGKPLISWTIEAAKQSSYIDRLILSSDDQEIIHIAQQWGCEVPFVRPTELALDTTPGIEPVLHALNECPGYDYVVLLQPTSPLRTTGDIDECIEMCALKGHPICVSVCESDHTPYWMYHLKRDNKISPFIFTEQIVQTRQEAPPLYVLNGAVYVAECDVLHQTRSFITPFTSGYVMPEERSLDIDKPYQMMIADSILSKV